VALLYMPPFLECFDVITACAALSQETVRNRVSSASLFCSPRQGIWCTCVLPAYAHNVFTGLARSRA
jgi:hypothetical protein